MSYNITSFILIDLLCPPYYIIILDCSVFR
jgi:hypothetical protein